MPYCVNVLDLADARDAHEIGRSLRSCPGDACGSHCQLGRYRCFLFLGFKMAHYMHLTGVLIRGLVPWIFLSCQRDSLTPSDLYELWIPLHRCPPSALMRLHTLAGIRGHQRHRPTPCPPE